MIRVIVKDEIDAEARTVWGLVGDLGHPESWPVVESFELEGSGVGCIRTLHLAGGEQIRERVEEYDASDQSYRARVTQVGRLPVADYEYRVAVASLAPGRCTVEWTVTCTPVARSEAEARHMIEGFYANLSFSIRESLGLVS